MIPRARWESPGFWLRVARGCALLVAATGAGVLLGWALDVALLKSISPDWVAMKANTALAFVCAGWALWLKSSESARLAPFGPGAIRLLSGVVVLLGALTLLEYLTDGDFGIDQWLFGEPADAIGTLAPGRMAPATALLFVFAGIALLVNERNRRGGSLVFALALLIALPALASGLAYVHGVSHSYGLGHVMQLAAHTVLAFLLLALGLLCAQPGHGFIVLLRSRGTDGALARRLLPFAVVLPLLIGALKLKGEKLGLFEPDFGVILVALSYIALLCAIVVWSARFRSRADAGRERANDVMAESEARLSALFRSIADPVWLKDAQGVYLACNPAFERLYGAKQADIVGKTDFDFVGGELAEFFRANDRAAIASGGAHDNEEWLTFADTGQRFLAETTKTPVRRDSGELLGVLGIARDITLRHRAEEQTRAAHAETERLLAESNRSRLALLSVLEDSKAATDALRRSEEELRQLNEELERRVQERTAQLAASNKELEAFSYSVSHDLRAPLRAIAGFTGLLKQHSYGGIDETGRHYMEVIAESAVKMGQLIDDILAFSRIGRAGMQPGRVGLDALLEETLNTLQPEMEGRRIEWRIHPLPEVRGERALLSLVLQNLLSNALKFTRTREAAVIEVGALDAGADETVCYVRDNGVGFDMQYADKLFGLFQRLHPQEQFAGTGVGLANVQRIIQRHGGRVWAEGKLDAGAAFYFALPKSGG